MSKLHIRLALKMCICSVPILFLSGCIINVRTEINQDGSGKLRIESDFPVEDSNAEPISVETCQQLIASVTSSSSTITVETPTGKNRCVLSEYFRNLEELASI